MDYLADSWGAASLAAWQAGHLLRALAARLPVCWQTDLDAWHRRVAASESRGSVASLSSGPNLSNHSKLPLSRSLSLSRPVNRSNRSNRSSRSRLSSRRRSLFKKQHNSNKLLLHSRRLQASQQRLSRQRRRLLDSWMTLLPCRKPVHAARKSLCLSRKL